MPRAMWRGAIQFGLVTIPVRLYLATESRGGLSFNMLHAEDLKRIQMKVHCPDHGEIKRSDTVRGYEWSKGQYVVLEESDLAAVPLKTVRSIEIEQFVPARRQDAGARFVKQSYYLEPEPVGRKAFALLKTVLADSELQAICKIVLKDREQLAALDPFGPTMLLSTLFWPDEVRDPADLDVPEEAEAFKPAEVEMARQLVDALTGEFDAARYKDEYREALLQVIDSKIAGQPVEAPTPEPETSKLTDLMAVLEASVAAARSEAAEPPAAGESGTGSTTPATASADEPVSVQSARKRRTATGQGAGAKTRRSTGKSAAKAKTGSRQARRKTA
ncbi:MAG: Ku protein [Chloroflexota bacterium]